MRETILLFQFEPDKQRKLAAQLLLSRFRIKVVTAQEMDLPIGYLAGDREVISDEEAAAIVSGSDGSALEGEMLVMAGVSKERMNAVLQAIRKSGIGALPYKAVVTPTNRSWKAKELLKELKAEHEAMKEQKSGGQMFHERS